MDAFCVVRRVPKSTFKKALKGRRESAPQCPPIGHPTTLTHNQEDTAAVFAHDEIRMLGSVLPPRVTELGNMVVGEVDRVRMKQAGLDGATTQDAAKLALRPLTKQWMKKFIIRRLQGLSRNALSKVRVAI